MLKQILSSVVIAAMLSPCAEAEQEEGKDELFYVVEIQDCFAPPAITVGTPEELKATQKLARERSRAITLAYKKTAKAWGEMEKERVEELREKAKKERKKDGKLPGIFKRPFLLKEPGLISVRGKGPYRDLDAAVQDAEKREKAAMSRQEFTAKSKERKLNQMSEQSRKSYEEQQALIEQQKKMFLDNLNSLAGKSGLLASGGNVKRMGGKISRLVKNTRRMMKPGANSKTATKVDQRAVQN